MRDIDSKSGNPPVEALRELHNALDSLETHLKQIAKSERVGPYAMDLVMQLRREINMRVSSSQRQRNCAETPRGLRPIPDAQGAAQSST